MAFLTFMRENARWLAGGFLLTLFSSFGQTFFIALSSGGIRAEYGLSHGEFGTIYMIATLGSALTLPQIGKIVDRVTVARVVLLICPVLALAAITMATAQSLLFLVLAIYGLRLFGQGMMVHTAMTAMGRWYVASRGRAVSIATLGHQFGEGTLPTVFVFVLAYVGWRSTWLIAAALIVLVGMPVIYQLMKVERAPRSTDGPVLRQAARDWTRGEVLRDPLFWMALVGVLAPGFIGTTIFFHQIYLVELRNWSTELMAGSYLLMSVMTVTFALIGGVLIDRFTAVRILPIFLLPLSIACFILGSIEAQWSSFAFMALLGVSYGLSSTLFGALWPELYGVKNLGSVRSVTVAMMVFSTAMGPGLTGYLIDLGVPYANQILIMGFYCLCAAGVMVLVSRKAVLRTEAIAAA